MNLRTQLQRILKRAGLTAWPKLWQNLRATRATELADRYPAHVAAALQLTAKSHLIAQRSLEVRDHQLMPGTSFNGCSIVSYVDEFRWS